jgi:hypothetical protein
MYNKLREKVKPNLGSMDRMVRFLLAIALVALVMFGPFKDWYIAFPLLLAIYLLITGNIAFCPLYLLFRWSTTKNENPG